MTDEPYTVKLSPGARRKLEAGPPAGIPAMAVFALLNFTDGPLRESPWRVSKPLSDEFAGFHGAHRGAYRLIFEINQEERIVRIARIDHRAGIYHY